MLMSLPKDMSLESYLDAILQIELMTATLFLVSVDIWPGKLDLFVGRGKNFALVNKTKVVVLN